MINDIAASSAYFGVLISVGGYALGLLLKKRFKLGIFNPLLVAIAAVMIFLMAARVSYTNYYNSAKYLSYLLTPATVCLAVPLYRQLSVLRRNLAAVLLGLGAGVAASLMSVFVLSRLFGFSHEMYVTLLPKSVTTAIGMDVAAEMGGSSGIAAAVIIVTGVLGNIIASAVCRIFRITNPVAVGLAIGCSAHAVGTARAIEIGEVEGAMSSLAIAVAGLMTVLGAPLAALLPM